MYLCAPPQHPAHAESINLGKVSDLSMVQSTGGAGKGARGQGGLGKMLMGPEKGVSL